MMKMMTSSSHWAPLTKSCIDWAADIIILLAPSNIPLRWVVNPFSVRENRFLRKWWSWALNLGYSSLPTYSLKEVDTGCHGGSGTRQGWHLDLTLKGELGFWKVGLGESASWSEGYYEQRDELWGILIMKAAGSSSSWAAYPGYRGAVGRKLNTLEGVQILSSWSSCFSIKSSSSTQKAFQMILSCNQWAKA